MQSRIVLVLSFAALLTACPKGTKTTSDAGGCPNNLKQNSSGACVECLASTDCTGATYCDSTGTCASCSQNPSACMSTGGHCTGESDCPFGDYCGPDSTCVAGCGSDNDCDPTMHPDAGLSPLSPTCCNHVCTNTTSDPSANCGGCGKAACATGDNCCSGVCSDPTTDINNCQACGTQCTGSGATCGANGCTTPASSDYAFLGLFDVSGNIRVSGGAPVPVELLKPFIYFASSNLASQVVGQSFCMGVHATAASGPTGIPNAGPINITGYAGGMDPTGATVSSNMNCVIENGAYVCGYGALSDAGVPGTDPSSDPLTASGGLLGSHTVSFSSPGGPDDGGYGQISASATPSAGLGVQEDLSTIQYSATQDTTLTLGCADAGNCGVGAIIAVVQASSNGALTYDDPTAASSGTVVCLSAFGSVQGFNLGPDSITITQSAISDMLGLAGGGTTQIGIASTGAYGVSTTIALPSPPDAGFDAGPGDGSVANIDAGPSDAGTGDAGSGDSGT